MSNFIEHLPHSCGSSDALAVFKGEDGYSGYCFSCSTYVPDPYSDNPPPKNLKVLSEKDIQEDLAEIAECGSMVWGDRRLNQSTLEYFDVRIGLSRQDGTVPEVAYFPYTSKDKIVAYKCKLLPVKKFWVVGSLKDVDFFGWKQAIASGSKTLYITEGEVDALTVYQVLRKKQKGTAYENNIPAVVSIPTGISAAKNFLSSKAAELKQFQEIVAVFDKDDAGKAGLEKVQEAFPNILSVDIPSKDPNAALMEGREKALANALLFRKELPKNTRIVALDTLVDAAVAPVEWGYSWPWAELDNLTRGLRMGETFYFGAGVKMGKTDMANTFITHFAIQHNLPVFIANLEQPNIQSTKKVLGKVSGKIFHDPTVEYHKDEVYDAAKRIKDKVHFLDAFQHVSWDTLKEDIYYCVNTLGVKLVLVDPITNLTNGVPSAEANTKLQEIAQDMSMMARDLNIAIFIFCHCKAPESGQPHERGGKILSHQFAGSRAMMRSCNYMLGLEGNKDPELAPEERNMRRLIMLEDREFGTSGVINLYWDLNTQLFNEVPTD